MPGSVKLNKAEFHQLDAEYQREIKPEKNVKVQFNPETLKVSFANQIQTPESTGDQRGTPARQFVGAGTTKLILQLWFDVNAPQNPGETVSDVRKMTEKVAYFITPAPDAGDAKKFVPPAVRFIWGSFQFDGLIESIEETLEFFSPEGVPLRASMSLSLSQQKIDVYKFRDDVTVNKLPIPGTRPLTPAPENATVQNLADKQGKGADWQSIAAANGIENPRQLQTGQFLDLNGAAKITAGKSASASISAGVTVSGSPALRLE